MNSDLKYIKKHYGEKFAHLCRDLFPTILETDGLLQDVITKNFAQSRELYDDIVKNKLEYQFKTYISSLVYKDQPDAVLPQPSLTPEELMLKAGYILFPECQTTAEVMRFKRYYAEGEELCTFRGDRLASCRVWFAVKENVDEIKREDFPNPSREDEYGTSVISIQFSKGDVNYLSIKNRYNHTVSNPDATFNNNLDNIIPGLKQAFEETYGLVTNNFETGLNIPYYVQTSTGKFIKYNIEIDGIYYCANNIIVQDGIETQLSTDNYLLFDNYKLDLKKGTITDCFSEYGDAFTKSLGKIKSFKRIVTEEGTTLLLTPQQGEVIEINLNKRNQIVGYSNPNVETIDDEFLYNNRTLTRLDLPNVKSVGNDFLKYNKTLKQLNMPKVRTVGNNFLYYNNSLSEFIAPDAESIGDDCLHCNNSLTKIDLSNVKRIGNAFMCMNDTMTELNLPNVISIGNQFFRNNNTIRKIDVSSAVSIGNNFLPMNNLITRIDLHNAEKIGDNFFYYNQSLTEIDVSNVKIVGNAFMKYHKTLKSLSMPNVEFVGDDFLYSDLFITSLYMPKVKIIGDSFLFSNEKSLTELDLSSAENIGDYFMHSSRSLRKLNIQNAKKVGEYLLDNNTALVQLIAPSLKFTAFQNRYIRSLMKNYNGCMKR